VNTTSESLLDSTELSAFRSLVDLALTEAAVGLQDLTGLQVSLGFTGLAVLTSSDFWRFIEKELEGARDLGIVEQRYAGRIGGVGLLLLTGPRGQQVVSLLDRKQGPLSEQVSLSHLEQEALVEVGSIVIGAAVGRIAESISDTVRYQPPRYIRRRLNGCGLRHHLPDGDGCVVPVKTVFRIEERSIEAHLLLVNSHESLVWLKTAINQFIRQNP